MKKVVIIQARMASTRLPGKVLKTLEGQTVLSHVLQRCAAIPGIDEVVCATVLGPDGDPIVAETKKCGATAFRGSENDVLERYYEAAKSVQADVIVRVTSDCPLIDPKLCGEVLTLLETNKAYTCNNMPPSWPAGLDCEAFTFAWLEKAAQEATRPSEREHVTPFIRNHASIEIGNIESPEPDTRAHRWTLDNPDDWTFFERLFAQIPRGQSGWDYQVPLKIVREQPELATINAHHHRFSGVLKSLKEDKEKGFSEKETPWYLKEADS